MRRAVVLLAGAVSLSSPGAFAQTVPVDTIEPSHRPERLQSATNESQGGISKPAISVLGSADDAEVALTIGMNPDKVIGNGGQEFASITFRAPLGDNGEGALLTQQGIPNKAGVDVAYTWILGASATEALRDLSPDVSAGVRAVEAKFMQLCILATSNSDEYLAIAADPNLQGKPDEIRQAQRTYLDTTCETGVSIWQRKKELLDLYLDDDDLRAISRSLDKWRNSSVTVVNLAGGAGYQEFEYLDPVGFGELSEDHTSFYASASVGFSFSTTSPFVGFGYQYRHDYEDAAKRVICPPPAAPGTTVECKNAIFDLPERDVDHSVFGLIRIANLFGDARWGDAPIVELKAAYDFEDDIFSASLPVYFIMDDAGDFKGGVRVGWEERGNDPNKDEFSAGFFIVKSFDFMGL